MSDDIEFVDGLFAKAPHDNAPDFVKAKLSIKRKDMGNWLRSKTDEWLNLDIKESKQGKWYVSVDTWQPDAEKVAQKPAEAVSGDDFDDEVPF